MKLGILLYVVMTMIYEIIRNRKKVYVPFWSLIGIILTNVMAYMVISIRDENNVLLIRITKPKINNSYPLIPSPPAP